MSTSSIYEDGTAEFALLRAIFPYLAAITIAVGIFHFGGFDAHQTGDAELDPIFARLSTRLAWMSLCTTPILGIFILWVNPPRLKLSRRWVAGVILGAVGMLAAVGLVVSTMMV